MIDFPVEIDDLGARQLEQWLEELRARLAQLDEQEPQDESSEAYDLWAQEHEDLEDSIDEVLDRLEEL